MWDPGQQNDPTSVAAEQRVSVLYHDPAVQVKRFGGEGTGAQSFFRYAWKPGETYRFALRATVTGNKTAYAAFFYINEDKKWKHLASFQTLSQGVALKGYYSFIEDFRRDGKSPHERRSASFGNGWVLTGEGHWMSLAQSTFTADATPLNNINASLSDFGYRLETGGNVTNTTPLNSKLNRIPTGLTMPENAATATAAAETASTETKANDK